MRRTDPSEAGFTLVELLVALTILSLSLAVLFVSISAGLEHARRASEQRAVTALAQSLMAEFGRTTPIKTGTSAGATAQGLKWKITVLSYGSEEDQKAWGAEAAKIVIEVNDEDGQKIRLSTLRILPKPDK